MKHFVSFVVLSVLAFDAMAAQSGRPAMSYKIMSAPRYTASVNQLGGVNNPPANAVNAINITNSTEATTATTDASVTPTSDERVAVTEPEVKIDMREAERNACINNNIGVGNTFVWASRYSNTNNYAGMVEDVSNPQNNVCFVRVELKSDDESRVSVADIAPKYFMWGENIECGSWADHNELEKRILDAKKGNRIAGIVASSIGGAAIGVGAMELFGNRLIGGKVEGQKNKNLSDIQVYRSQLLTLREKNPSQYQEYAKSLRTIKKACDNQLIDEDDFDCNKYASLLEEFGR